MNQSKALRLEIARPCVQRHIATSTKDANRIASHKRSRNDAFLTWPRRMLVQAVEQCIQVWAHSTQASRRTWVAATLLGTAVMATPVMAQSLWNGSVDTQWNTTGNWSAGTPNAAGSMARFLDDDANLNNKTITVGGSVTLGELNVGSGSGADNSSLRSFSLSGGTLNFNNSGTRSKLSVSGNRGLTINSALSVTDTHGLSISNDSQYGTALTITSALSVGSGGLATHTAAGASVILNGPVSGSGNSTKTGSGTLALNGNNTLVGTFAFNEGTIALGDNHAFGSATVDMSGGNNQTFSIASGSRALTNTITFGNTLDVVGSGNTLTLSGNQTSTLTNPLSLGIGSGATLDLGPDFKLAGNTLSLQGGGTLKLESASNSFNGLDILQGTVQTGSFTNTLTIGAVTGGNHMLGTGALNLDGQSAKLIINAASTAASVDFADGTNKIASGATIEVKNGAATTFNGGSLDFGSSPDKGQLLFSGNVTLGNTSFLNASGGLLSIGGNLTLNAGSNIANSGINLLLNSNNAQTVSGPSTLDIAGDLAHQGSGTATLSGISTLNVGSLTLTSGTFDLGVAQLNTGTINLGGGILNLHAANQITPSTFLTTQNGTTSTLNLNGFDQSYAGLLGGGALTFNLGGVASTTNTLNLGIWNNTLGSLRISDWDGTPTNAIDRVYLSSDPGTANLANVWFKGYGQGASVTNIGGGLWELLPSQNLVSEWNGEAGTANRNWATGSNWVGGDAYNVPDHAGATANFTNAAGSLSGVTINLGGNRTLGSLSLNSSSSTSSTGMTFNGGSIIFDSGVAGQAASLITTTAPWPHFSGRTQLNSDLNVTAVSNVYFDGGLAGTKKLTINSGNIYLGTNNSSYFSGDIEIRSGQLNYSTVASGYSLGTGRLLMNGGTITGPNAVSGGLINNELVMGGNFNSSYTTFNYAGDVALNAVYTVGSTYTPIYDNRSSVIFASNLNLVGVGGLNFNGSGTKEILSQNNTFSGGLTVSGGTLYTTLTSDLALGALAMGHNYLGSGNITATGSASILSVSSHGNSGALAGSILSVANGGQFRYLDGGAFTLDSGTLDGGTNTAKGTLLVAGDLTFGGSAYTNSPNITVNTTTNPAGTTTVWGTGTVASGVGTFTKAGAGTTTLDSGITSFAPGLISVNNGVLQLGRDEQIANGTPIVLSGGTLSANNFIDDHLGSLSLTGTSSLFLGNSGSFTFANAATGATSWVDGKILTIQNGGQDWRQAGSTYVRFVNAPSFTAAQLSNIAFTGYESGAIIDNSLYAGYHTLLPSLTALPTTEWNGQGSGAQRLWSDAGDWLGNIVPNAAGTSATIRDLDPNLDSKTLDVDGTFTVGRLNIEASAGQNLTLGGAGSLIFDDGGAGNALFKTAGVNTTTIESTLQLSSHVRLQADTPIAAGYLNMAGMVTGSGGFTKTGSGVLQYSGSAGASDYAGGFLWQDASLIQINASGSLFGSGVWTIGDGTGKTYLLETTNGVAPNTGSHTVSTDYVLAGNVTLQKDTALGTTISDSIGTDNVLRLSGAGALDAGVKTINVFGNNAVVSSTYRTEYLTLSLDGNLTGAGGILKTGSGDLTLNGANNTFSGGVDLKAGWVNIAHDQALGVGAFKASNTGAAYQAGLSATAGTPAAPLVLSNRLDWAGQFMLYGNFNFNYAYSPGVNNPSQLTGTVGLAVGSGNLVTFGAGNVLAGTGRLSTGSAGSWSNYGTLRFLAANTYSGGTYHFSGLVQVGADSVKDGAGGVISGALGTGTFTSAGGTLGAYSDTGSGITSRTFSNSIVFATNRMLFGAYGDATTLVLDTPTLMLRNGSGDLTLTGDNGFSIAGANPANANPILSIASQLIDDTANGYAGGFTKNGIGIVELKNGNNQISGGIVVNGGTVRATASGDITTGRLDAGHNYLGTGTLSVATGGLYAINTTDGSNVRLSGGGISMNGSGNVTVSGGANVLTWLDSNANFTGTSTTGSLTTPGTLIKSGAGTLTHMGARLVTPTLDIQDGTLALTQANLVGGVGQLELSGGTLATGGFNQTFSNTTGLTLTDNSHIDFGSGASKLTIGNLGLTADQRYVGDSSYTLSVDNWGGNASVGGGADQFVVLNGLTTGQKIYNIWFTGGYAAGAKTVINSDGKYELVPLGVAFIWDSHTGNSLWSASNWANIVNANGAPVNAGDTAVFADNDAGLNGRTITVGSNVSVGAISFESTQGQVFTIAGNNALTLASGDATQDARIRLAGNASPIIASNLTLSNDLLISAVGTGTLKIDGAINGSGRAVTIEGSTGTVLLASSNSNYTAGLTIDGGHVAFGASSLLDGFGGLDSGPAGIGTLTLNGGVLSAHNGAQTLHNRVVIGGSFEVAGTNPLTLAGDDSASAQIAADATITVADAAGSLTFGANLPLAGSATLTKDGAGTLNFNSNGAAYTGNLVVNEGTVGIGVANGFGTGNVSLNDGAILTPNVNGLTIASTMTLSGTSTVATGANNLTLSGAMGGTGAFSKTGNGTLTLSGNSTYSGGTQVNTGSVTLTQGRAAGTGTTTLSAGTSLDLTFASDTLTSGLGGSGTTNVTSDTQVTLGGNSSGYNGTLNIAGTASATIGGETSLGNAQVANNGNLTINTTTNWTLSNSITGTGSLTKTGTGNVTLNQASTRTGITAINGGTLTLTDPAALGNGNITVSTTFADASQGLNLAFASAQTFNNTLLGNGTTRISGAGLTTIASDNTGYSGTWSISGKATLPTSAISSTANFGSGRVDLTSTGTLTLDSDSSFTFANALSGSGELIASNNGNAFSFSSAAGSAFAGTLTLTENTFNLSGDNTTALRNATLNIGQDNVTTVGDGEQRIGGLSFDGGTAVFNADIPAEILAASFITTSGVLDTRGTGTIMVHEPSFINNDPPIPNTDASLLEQDDDNALIQLVKSTGTTLGNAANLALVDDDGSIITDAEQIDINQGGQKVAVATYDYGLTTGTSMDGLYVNYGLTQLDLIGTGNEALVLTPDTGATGAARNLSAKLTGSGDLAIEAGANQLVSLSNSANDYTGQTFVRNGTLVFDNNNVLGQTNNLEIASNARLDTNGYSQDVGAIHAKTNSQLQIGSGSTLTITRDLRGGADTSGGALEAGTLRGAGTLVVDSSILPVNGAQNGFTGKLEITGGSQVMLNTANALSNAQGLELVGANDILTFGNLSSINPAWTAIAQGTAAMPIRGIGTVQINDGSDITLSGNSSTFSGTWSIDTLSTLRAVSADGLGSANITNAGTFDAIANTDWQLNNTVSGDGTFTKTGLAMLSVDQALSGFTGQTNVQTGTLVIGTPSMNNAQMGGPVSVASGATLSGNGLINGDVDNAGSILALNAITAYKGSASSNLTIDGTLTSSGSIVLGGGSVGNTLTVNNFKGQGGTLVLHSILGDDTSRTDRLIINGGQADGSTALSVINQGGLGAQTTGDGILVISAENGATTTTDAFALSGRVAAGAYDYSLYRADAQGSGESWYLRSAASPRPGPSPVRPEVNLNSTLMPLAAELGYAMLGTLHDRVGDTDSSTSAPNCSTPQNNGNCYAGAWGRLFVSRGKHDRDNFERFGSDYDYRFSGGQAGLDVIAYEHDGALERAGFYVSNSQMDAEAKTSIGAKAGDIDMDAMALGAYWTHRSPNGWYTDIVAQGQRYHANSKSLGGQKVEPSGVGLMGSVEGGYSISYENGLTLQPQAQLIYQHLSFDDASDQYGQFRFEDGKSLRGRLGMRMVKNWNRSENLTYARPTSIWARANLWHDFTSEYQTEVTTKEGKHPYLAGNLSRGTWGEIGAGVTAQVTNNMAVFATGSYNRSLDDNSRTTWAGRVGVTISW